MSKQVWSSDTGAGWKCDIRKEWAVLSGFPWWQEVIWWNFLALWRIVSPQSFSMSVRFKDLYLFIYLFANNLYSEENRQKSWLLKRESTNGSDISDTTIFFFFLTFYPFVGADQQQRGSDLLLLLFWEEKQPNQVRCLPRNLGEEMGSRHHCYPTYKWQTNIG